jgi:hypothetical protein
MIGDVSQEYLQLIIKDETDRQLEVITQWQPAYSELRSQMKCECIVASPSKDFNSLSTITEVWVPSCDCWVGDYPYVNRDRFQSLIYSLEAAQFAEAKSRKTALSIDEASNRNQS